MTQSKRGIVRITGHRNVRGLVAQALDEPESLCPDDVRELAMMAAANELAVKKMAEAKPGASIVVVSTHRWSLMLTAPHMSDDRIAGIIASVITLYNEVINAQADSEE